ncbi:MAG: hypothetical protein ACJ0BU_02765 [Candidatus Puniceispirillales bacterium]|tara:strand:+ start:813 stop:986 length:174 start_codon:yes stop_codon:yes gene_type:complete
MRKDNLLKIKNNQKIKRDLDFKLCSLEIKNGFNDFIVIAKNENGFVFRLSFKNKKTN